MASYPTNLLYTKDHEWARVSGAVATVGITTFAKDQLGDVVYLELPEVGAQVKRGEPFGVVESTKAVSELFAPCTGAVIKVNKALADAPEAINDDPHEAGWMIEIQIANQAELSELLDAPAYEKLVAAGH